MKNTSTENPIFGAELQEKIKLGIDNQSYRIKAYQRVIDALLGLVEKKQQVLENETNEQERLRLIDETIQEINILIESFSFQSAYFMQENVSKGTAISWEKILENYPIKNGNINKKNQTIRTAILLLVQQYTEIKTGNTALIKKVEKWQKHKADYDPSKFQTRQEVAQELREKYGNELPPEVDYSSYYPEIIQSLSGYLHEKTMRDLSQQ